MSSEQPQVYSQQVLDFISSYQASIKGAASAVAALPGLPGVQIGSGAIEKFLSGFIAEEYNDRNESFLDRRKQQLGDWIASIESPWMASSISEIDSDQTLWDLTSDSAKIRNPALIDVGPANIQTYTAIVLLREYVSYFPADPLQIAHYLSDPAQLTFDLQNQSLPTTAIIGSLGVAHAANWLSTHADNWSSLSD